MNLKSYNIEKAQRKIFWALTNINNKTTEYEKQSLWRGHDSNAQHKGVQSSALPDLSYPSV